MPVYERLSRSEVSELAAQFGVQLDSEPMLLSGGSANVNYLIKSGADQFVLAVCEGKSTKEIQVLCDLLKHLEERSFTTSRVYYALNGKAFATHKGKPVILKSFLEGNVPLKLTAMQALELGREMGRLHKIKAPEYLPLQHDYDIHAFPKLTRQIKGHPFAEWVESTSNLIEAAIPSGSSKGLVHGDIFCDNLVVDENGITIMDFEEVCFHYLMFDLGMAVVGTCCPDMIPDQELIDHLLEGYKNESPLASDELKFLDLFALYAAAGTAVWRFRQFNLVTPSKEYSDHYLKMVALADLFKARMADS